MQSAPSKWSRHFLREMLRIAVCSSLFGLPVCAEPIVGGGGSYGQPKETQKIGISDQMSRLLSVAKENGEVLRLWGKISAGDPSAISQIFALAQKGNAEAQNTCGYMLDNGIGVRKDSATAVRYFYAAANKFPLAQYNLGVLMFYGRGIKKDVPAAVEYFKSSAIKASVSQASVQVALFYLRQKDLVNAEKWANEGASRGNVQAFYVLGRVLYIKQRYRDAWSWLSRAIEASEINSAALISSMYKDGKGVGQNKSMAAAWWLIYTAAQRKIALNLSVVSGFGLTADEEQRARAFANNWLATHRLSGTTSYSKTLLKVS